MRTVRLLAVVVLVAAVSPRMLQAQDAAPCEDRLPDLVATPESGKTPEPGIGTIALEDSLHVLGAPLHWSSSDWIFAGAAAVSVVAAGFAFDIPARKATQDHQTATLDELTKVVEPFGAEYSYAVLGIYGIAGFVFRDREARDIAIDGAMASLLASGIVTPILKEVVGRARPNQNEGSTSFDPFSSDKSFPSGHATQAFAVASVIAAHSDQVWVNVTAYTVAGLVGFSRVYHDAHWVSDVAAGALIGTVVGRSVVALNTRLREQAGGLQVAIAPVFGRDTKALTIALSY